jgi:hypothetical protein
MTASVSGYSLNRGANIILACFCSLKLRLLYFIFVTISANNCIGRRHGRRPEFIGEIIDKNSKLISFLLMKERDLCKLCKWLEGFHNWSNRLCVA